MATSKVRTSHFIDREYPALDGIRGLAIIMVLLAHIGFTPTGHAGIFFGGVLGVDMFLVLSGFLIVSALLKDYHKYSRIRYARFYSRRAARILPALLLYLFVASIISILFPEIISRDTIYMAVLGSLTFSLNIVIVSTGTFCDPMTSLWSLSVEEQFYFIMPVLLTLMIRYPSRMIWFAIAITPILISMLTRYPGCVLGMQTDPSWHMDAFFSSASKFMGQTTGVILGVLWRFGLVDFESASTKKVSNIAILVFLLSLIVSHLIYIHPSCLSFDLVCLATLGLIVIGMSNESTAPKRFLQNRFLRFTGKISYGLYLWNTVCFWLVAQLFTVTKLEHSLISILACYIIAVLSHYLLEMPVLNRVRGMLFTS